MIATVNMGTSLQRELAIFMPTHLKLNTVSSSVACHVQRDQNLLNDANCSSLIASLQQQVETPAAVKPALN